MKHTYFLYLSLLLLSFVGEEQFGLVSLFFLVFYPCMNMGIFQTFVCQSLGLGIGAGLVFVPTTVVPLHYFKRKRGMVLGIVMSGGSLGSMIFPVGEFHSISLTIQSCS